MKRLLILIMFMLFFLCIFVGISVQGAGLKPSASYLEASMSGALEIGKPSTLWIEIGNNAPIGGSELLGLREGEAMGITAELRSSDDRIRVISSQQVAGSLSPGENRSLEFTAQIEGAQPGIYPLKLLLSYSMPSQFRTSGNSEMPDILFEYENFTQIIPLEARAVMGPKIKINNVRGNAYPGKESDLEILFVNHGDTAANDLKIDVRPQGPFESAEIFPVQGTLEPKASMPVRLKVFADANSTPGIYALPFMIFYRGGGPRVEEAAALVSIQRDAVSGWMIVPFAGGLLVLAGYLSIKKYSKKKKRRKSLIG